MSHADHTLAPAIRVLVIDDQRLIREALATVLTSEPGITVVGSALDVRDAVKQAESLSPDVVLAGVRLPIIGGIERVAILRRGVPDCRVLVLSIVDDEEYIGATLRAGAIGYLLTSISAADLRHAVRLAHEGVASFDSPIGREFVRTADGARCDAATGSTLAFAAQILTSRELEVLRLIGEGATNREIAERLVIGEGTVKNHVSSVLARLGLRSRTQAAVFAHDHTRRGEPNAPE